VARILVAGGSLGGLMCANLLARAGHEVTVLEKASGNMDGRGAGIITHSALIAGLRRCGMAPDVPLGVNVRERITLDSQGAVLGTLAMPQLLTSWSRLYQILRGLLPDASHVRYRQGVTVREVRQLQSEVRVLTNAGEFEADVLVAADGIRSAVRQQLWPQVQPEYAGYIAWRGLCAEISLSRECLDTVFERFGFCLPPGEQLLGYPVAGPGNRSEPGHRAWNFVWYRAAAPGERLAELMTDAEGVHHPQGIPPNKVSAREIARMREDARRLVAPVLAEIIEKTTQPFLQPIHDVMSDRIAQGRVALLGDAAFVARPHVGMGVTKAMQDAVALVESLDRHGATPAALQAYAQGRLAAGQDAVQRSRRLGAYMQACGLQGSEPQPRDADAVMAETAVDLDRVPVSLSTAG
jgi:2-polyprenyl-6-methoxyphenol hydroxylase-like FAD-dependent oxidoreductase